MEVLIMSSFSVLKVLIPVSIKNIIKVDVEADGSRRYFRKGILFGKGRKYHKSKENL